MNGKRHRNNWMRHIWYLWAGTVYVNPEDDGTYLLEQGKEYTIEIYGYSSSKFDFTVEQDNWVYAPDGGIWKMSDSNYYSEYRPTKVLYISPKLIVDATCGYIDNSYEQYVIYTDNDIKKIMTMISGDKTSEINATISIAVSLGGVVMMFINSATGVVGAIIELTSAGITVTVGLSAGYSIIEIINMQDIEDALKDGNMHIDYCIYSLKYYNNYNPWCSNEYINKINLGIPGNVNKNLTYQQVQEICRFTNFDN